MMDEARRKFLVQQTIDSHDKPMGLRIRTLWGLGQKPEEIAAALGVTLGQIKCVEQNIG